MSIDPKGFECGWPLTVRTGATRKQPRPVTQILGKGERGRGGSRDGQKSMFGVFLRHLSFHVWGGRTSEENGGLIGEGCWKLSAGQRGRCGRRKTEWRRGGARERKRWMPPSGRQTSSPSTDAIPSYLLRRMNHCNGIKQNKLARYYVCTEKWKKTINYNKTHARSRFFLFFFLFVCFFFFFFLHESIWWHFQVGQKTRNTGIFILAKKNQK